MTAQKSLQVTTVRPKRYFFLIQNLFAFSFLGGRVTLVTMKSAVIFFCVLALVSVANSVKHKTGKGICDMCKISEHGICKIFDPCILYFSPLGHGGRKSVVVIASPVQSELRYP